MAKKPTQREIAAEAGVCLATVSLALRNHPSIPETTREQIRKVADRLGYRLNPRVAELMVHIRRNRSVEALRETVALVWPDMPEKPLRAIPHMCAFEQAVKQTLQQNGVGVSLFYREPDQAPRQLERILRSRGIRGVILAPLLREPEIRLDWNWSHHSVVIAGSARFHPEFNRVRFNHFADMGILLHQLRKEGKQRIGLEIYHSLEERSQHAINGGFWAGVPPETRKEDAVFFSDNQDRAAFQKWLKSYRPDCLILSSIHAYRWLPEIDDPPPVVMRTLENLQGTDHPPGIHQNYTELGNVAAEQLLSQLQLHQMGIPHYPKQTLITGEWREA